MGRESQVHTLAPNLNLLAKKCGLTAPKSPKLTFFGKNLPKRGIPLEKFLQNLAWGRISQFSTVTSTFTIVALTRSSAVAKRLHVCIASIQNVEHSLFILVVSASDIPLRTIKFFSVLFCSAYWPMLQAVTNKHSMVSRRLCDLHCMVVGNCFCHFVVRTFSNLR